MTAEAVSEMREAPAWLRAIGVFLRGLPRGRYPRMARLGSGQTFAAEFPFEGRRIRFWCDLRNSLAREVFFLGSYEPQETLLLPALLRRGDTCVYVGAHWGYFSLLAAATPQGEAAFEVPSEPLDGLIEQHGVTDVGLLKLDIEEAGVLAAERCGPVPA